MNASGTPPRIQRGGDIQQIRNALKLVLASIGDDGTGDCGRDALDSGESSFVSRLDVYAVVSCGI